MLRGQVGAPYYLPEFSLWFGGWVSGVNKGCGDRVPADAFKAGSLILGEVSPSLIGV